MRRFVSRFGFSPVVLLLAAPMSATLLSLLSAFAPAIAQAAPAAPTDIHVAAVMLPWKGDFDAMVKRRVIRVLVPFSKTFYYVERGRPRGVTYDVFTAFEADVNKQFQKKPTLKLHVVFLPVGRDELVPKLVAGYGDVIFADLTTMQIMPVTGKELKVGDIHVIDNNVHGGVKYVRFLMDRYFKDEPMTRLDKGLFTFAAYNAGPGRVAQLRREAAKRGVDPNRRFNNGELVAADKIGPETVTYVANIFKYYTAYRSLEAEEKERDRAREQLQKAKPS